VAQQLENAQARARIVSLMARLIQGTAKKGLRPDSAIPKAKETSCGPKMNESEKLRGKDFGEEIKSAHD
jgi:hypothetical protein